jgi:hypothetical protein
MYGYVQAAKAGGLSMAQIITSLKRDSNLGSEELGFISQGMFRPVSLSEKVFRDVYIETAIKGEPRAISELPAEELAEIYKSFVGRPLISETITTEESTSFTPEPVSQEESTSFTPEPLSQAQPAQPAQPVAAAPAPPVAAQAEVGSPLSTSAPVSIASNQQLQQQLVGGGNPINAAKNAQISRTV